MKVAVIGAGTMGAGIAQTFAQAGYDVSLCDINEDLAIQGKNRIRKNLENRAEKGRLPLEAIGEILGRVTTGTKDICTDARFFVEAVSENTDIKRRTLKELERIAPEDCIFASNTSSLSITELGAGLSHPLVGMHFFNPAPEMELVEVITGEHTPSNVKNEVVAIAKKLGKTPVEVNEAPGFVVNRILIPMINEAIGIYAAGTASAEDIDTAMRLGANHPIGPLALGDLVGLDVCLAIMEILQKETEDLKYRPHPLLREKVQAGQLGRKTGCGFYKY